MKDIKETIEGLKERKEMHNHTSIPSYTDKVEDCSLCKENKILIDAVEICQAVESAEGELGEKPDTITTPETIRKNATILAKIKLRIKELESACNIKNASIETSIKMYRNLEKEYHDYKKKIDEVEPFIATKIHERDHYKNRLKFLEASKLTLDEFVTIACEYRPSIAEDSGQPEWNRGELIQLYNALTEGHWLYITRDQQIEKLKLRIGELEEQRLNDKESIASLEKSCKEAISEIESNTKFLKKYKIQTVEKLFNKIKDNLIGIWKYHKEGQEERWCCTYRKRGLHFDTKDHIRMEDALKEVAQVIKEEVKE